MKKEKIVTDYLKDHISTTRKELIEKVLQQRTNRITVVLEDLYQSLNASAVLRSCDGFGIQNVHFIQHQKSTIEIKKNIAMGTTKWLTLHTYKKEQENQNPLIEAYQSLKKEGYMLVATSPHAVDTLETLSLDSKVALIFGTEDEGLTNQALELADTTVKIPMFGFAESFNVSVTVALCLYALTTRLRQSNIKWQLSLEEEDMLRYIWYKSAVRNGDIYERQLLKS